MAKNKLTVDFSGIEEFAERLEKLGDDLKIPIEDALKKSKRLVHQQLGSAMQKHNRTHQTVKSLSSQSSVEWEGPVASIDVGFDISHGGLPSIFLMYGTPRMQKDPKVYNAIYGAATKKKIAKLQAEIFSKAISERL